MFLLLLLLIAPILNCPTVIFYLQSNTKLIGLVGSVGCVSDWWPGGRGFNPHQVGNILLWRLIMTYSWLSLSRPLLSRSYHLCRTDFQVPIIFLIYLLYFSFAYVELLLCRHFGYLVHHFQSLNKFFTVFTTAYLELGPWRRKTKCKMRRCRSLS